MSKVSDRRFIGVALGACALVGCVMVGCASDEPQRIAHGYYPDRDITPSSNSTEGDQAAVDRMIAFSRDTNLRRMNDDLHRLLMIDKPNSLSPKRGIWY